MPWTGNPPIVNVILSTLSVTQATPRITPALITIPTRPIVMMLIGKVSGLSTDGLMSPLTTPIRVAMTTGGGCRPSYVDLRQHHGEDDEGDRRRRDPEDESLHDSASERWTTCPPTTVTRALVPMIADGPAASRSRSSTTRSASRPGAIRPRR